MQQTALYQEHVDLKGNIVPFAGWMLPVQYTSIKDEVMTVRNDCGVFDVSHMGEFIVEGLEARKFVNYIICNDIANSPVGKATYSPLLNDQGKCLDDLIVYILSENKILICVNASNIEKDWNWVQKIFNQVQMNVQIKNVSSAYSLLALQGPKAEQILENVLKQKFSALEYYGVQCVQHLGQEIIIARTGYTGEDGFEIFMPNNMAKDLWRKFLAEGAKPCGLGARDCLRVEVAYPLYGHELSEELTPLDAGLKWTVKMKKQDFIGKNALTTYKPQFVQIKFFATKGIPREGYLLKSVKGEILGKVTSGTLSPTINRGIGLGLINVATNINEEILLEIRGQTSPIEIVNAPFVKGGHK